MRNNFSLAFVIVVLGVCGIIKISGIDDTHFLQNNYSTLEQKIISYLVKVKGGLASIRQTLTFSFSQNFFSNSFGVFS